MSRPRGARAAPAIALGALLVLLTAGVFARVTAHPFAGFDDNVYLLDNLHVRDGLTARGLVWAFTTLHAANWHPLTWLSHMLDVRLFGMEPGGHHLTSLALHAANTALLFLALRALTGALLPAALVGALFGVHPLHVESVAWLAERKDVLSTLFAMLTLLAWVRYARRPSPARYLAAAAVFALGLLAKPMLVTLPLVLLLLDLWPLGRAGGGVPSARLFGRLLLEKAPLLALAAASSAVTLVAQRAGHAVITLWMIPLGARVANALASYLLYARKTAWPSGLSLMYPFLGSDLPAWQVGAAAFLLACLTAAAFLAWRRRPYLAIGWLWYLGTLVPVIGLVQVGDQGMADRYTYVPLVGLFLAAVWAGAALAAGRGGAAAALSGGAVAAVAAFAAAAWLQVGRWRDDQSLFGNAIAVAGQNWQARLNLGAALFRQGRHAEAIAQYEEARRAMPAHADIYYNLGLAYAAQRRFREAADAYAAAARIRPGDADTQTNLCSVLIDLGRNEEALARCREAVRLRPDDDLAFQNMAVALIRLGRGAEAGAAAAAAERVRAARRAMHPSLR